LRTLLVQKFSYYKKTTTRARAIRRRITRAVREEVDIQDDEEGRLYY